MNPPVLHVTSWLSRSGGGIPPVVWALARETTRLGFPASVVGLNDQWVNADCKADGFPFAAGEVVGPRGLGYSPALRNQLRDQVQPGAVVHSHGLWMYPGLAARQCAGQHHCPLVISPHGMLEPWAVRNSGWKKKLAGLFFETENLRRAGCLHALCHAEAENIRRYGLANPIVIIPNGVEMSEILPPEHGALGEKFPGITGRRHVLFLSRLHPKKGLLNLLRAWQKMTADFKDWQLLVAGSGEPGYEQRLKDFSRDMISNQSVVFLGPLYGGEKRQALALADVFVLPSFSEGFSLAILEASAAGVPVLLTPECNFPELVTAGAALEVRADASAVESGLRQLLALPGGERAAMGRRGRELVAKSYTWRVVAEQMCRVYAWLAGQAPMPETVSRI